MRRLGVDVKSTYNAHAILLTPSRSPAPYIPPQFGVRDVVEDWRRYFYTQAST